MSEHPKGHPTMGPDPDPDTDRRRRADTAPKQPRDDRPREVGALSGLLTGASFLTGFGGAMVLAHDRFPRPGSDPEQIRTYFHGSARAARFSATGQLISAVSLARFTASVARMAARSAPGSRTLPAAAIAGGGLAVASLTTAAVTHAMLTGRRKDDDHAAVAMARRVFVAGGPVHGVGFGVLTAVLGLAGLRTGELPRPAAITALVSAVSGLLSPLYFLWEPAGWLIPGGRFPGLVISGIAGVRLSRRRPE